MINFTEVGEAIFMKKKIFFIIFCLIMLGLILFLSQQTVYEKVYDSSYFSGDTVYKNSDSYDIWVNDDSITYSDELGNAIVYLFDADRLYSVYTIYVLDNEVEARKVAAYYSKQIGNGEIAEVSHNQNNVTVIMDMNYFAEYKDYTKKQIEDILLENAQKVEED